jgi:hypothetical protein
MHPLPNLRNRAVSRLLTAQPRPPPRLAPAPPQLPRRSQLLRPLHACARLLMLPMQVRLHAAHHQHQSLGDLPLHPLLPPLPVHALSLPLPDREPRLRDHRLPALSGQLPRPPAKLLPVVPQAAQQLLEAARVAALPAPLPHARLSPPLRSLRAAATPPQSAQPKQNPLLHRHRHSARSRVHLRLRCPLRPRRLCLPLLTQTLSRPSPMQRSHSCRPLRRR